MAIQAKPNTPVKTVIRNKNIAVRQQTVNRQSVQAAFKIKNVYKIEIIKLIFVII